MFQIIITSLQNKSHNKADDLNLDDLFSHFKYVFDQNGNNRNDNMETPLEPNI